MPAVKASLQSVKPERMIVIVLHRGPEVAAITLAEARDLCVLSCLLESFAAGEFTRLASDAQLNSLAKTVARLRQAGRGYACCGVLNAKAEFYRILFESCGNTLLAEILSGLLARASLLRATSLMLPARLPSSLEEIEALLACIQQRDAKSAEKMARLHVLNAERTALSVFERQ